MKPINSIVCLSVFFITFSNQNFVRSQESATDKMHLLDLKLQLIDSKLELLDSKIKIWETKPQELELNLQELNEKIAMLDFQPEEFNTKFWLLDSLITEQKKFVDEKKRIKDQLRVESFRSSDSLFVKRRKYTVALNPVRVFEGSLEISIERVINSKNSFEISGMATYATDEGISNFYLSNQQMEYYNDAISAYDPYESKNISGFGTTLQWKNYLLSTINRRYTVLKGLYAAPYTMYRRIWITGMDRQFNEEEDIWEDIEIVQKLHVLAGGVIIGWQFPIAKVLTVDVFVGGVIRLTKNDDESELTKYKKWDNIDYSGVLPRVGIKIGILK